MKETRKLVIFDLDTNLLKIYYPKKNWNYAYEDIKLHMKKNSFEWIQGSSYVSKEPMSSIRLGNIIKDLIKKNQWLHLCMRDCKETEVGRMYQKNDLFNKNIKLETREELIQRKVREARINTIDEETMELDWER